ncbi:MAG: helicase C-terminal domain-containing protein [Actinomycetota bacterium]|nr:helicase C-terminal domain-containing protein [Actinomycetota bacterium]
MKGWTDDYSVLEVITTGPDPETALPVEAAAIRVRNGIEVDAISVIIDPGVPVPASLRERSKREEEEHRNGLEPRTALSRVNDFLGQRHVLAYEGMAMEAAVLERYGALPAGPVLDVQELAWLTLPYLRDHSLPSLCSSLLGETPTCRALEDSRLLLRLISYLTAAWGEIPRRARGAILRALKEADSPLIQLLKGSPSNSLCEDLSDMIARVEPASPGAEENAVGSAAARGKTGPLDSEEVHAVLSPGGPLASSQPDHEIRPQQLTMAEAVSSAFNDSCFLAVEAGTGVGKSLAYLVPGALHARRGRGPLVVSTYTRNLQEQLFHRDLPLLSRSLGGVEFSLLKGRNNYICLRKWSEWCRSLAGEEPSMRFGEPTPYLAYAYLVSWMTNTSSGDLEEISLNLREDLSGLLRELSSSSEECLRPFCPFSFRCWVEKARCQTARSEIVVINHALLLSQLSQDDGGPCHLILPDHRLLVVDEAHHLEDVATEVFTLTFSLRDSLKMLDDISDGKGILARLERFPIGEQGLGKLSQALEKATAIGEGVRDLFLRLLDRLFAPEPSGPEAGRYRLVQEIVHGPAWEEAREKGLVIASHLLELSELLTDATGRISTLEDEDLREEGRVLAKRGESLAYRARESAAALEVFLCDPFCEEFDRHLRWVERSGYSRGGSDVPEFAVKSAPVSVGEVLRSLLFSTLEAATLTSASLRVPGAREGFSFFLQRTGLDLIEEEGGEVRLLALDSPFDYASQVRLIAVEDLPEPQTGKPGFGRYMSEISRVVEEALVASGGKALVLLTSHRQVEYLDSHLRPRLEQRGMCCLRQRRGVPNALLLERFRSDRDSVLLATEAFWEGVDVPGESLSAVIVVKLPFRHPADPVVAGRMEHQDRRGVGGWRSYYVPLAVTLFRQGIGRLLRRSSDTGVIVVLDPRFLTRSYSGSFRAVLPGGLRMETVKSDGLADALSRGPHVPRSQSP